MDNHSTRKTKQKRRRRANLKLNKDLTNRMITESNEKVEIFYEKIQNDFDRRKNQLELEELNRKQIQPLLIEIDKKRSELISTLEKIITIENYRKSLSQKQNQIHNDDEFYRIFTEQKQLIREQLRSVNRQESYIRNRILSNESNVKPINEQQKICRKNPLKSINFNRLLRLYRRRQLSTN
ncbi:hypothetical protein DERP_014604 [Dermatophagoides pteronyssinus]|uniref:Uncharacterized protein n=1 Tax=Dermatophagoides pteronyssinus TaxID=6956 RepID=A0ABQ8IVX0_DERPT|nr:hypothetical protein DERP_014604 [Dermatophagoides pteronyssinus]